MNKRRDERLKKEMNKPKEEDVQEVYADEFGI